MMYYWPVSIFLRDPHLSSKSKWELITIGQPGVVLSEGTMAACHQIAAQNPHGGTSMVLICNEQAPIRRAYLKHPGAEEWAALERGGFVADSDSFGFVMDALH